MGVSFEVLKELQFELRNLNLQANIVRLAQMKINAGAGGIVDDAAEHRDVHLHRRRRVEVEAVQERRDGAGLA